MSITDPDELEREYRLEKLKLECERLRYDNAPHQRRIEKLKGFAATTGVVSVAVAVVGMVVAVGQWRSNIRQSEENRAYERLGASISQLTSEREQARLGGVVALTSFVQEDDPGRKLQVLRALVTATALEPSPLVRESIVSAVGELDVKTFPSALQT